MQRALCGAPADPTLSFILDTDASGVGMGGVLSQEGPEGERVVAYFSWAFNKAERHYCVTRRELLAQVFSIRHFKYYLCGPPFTVRTERAALKWLMSFKEPEGQVARWLEEPQAFNLTVEHRAGVNHTNADALSRRPCASDGCRYCERREAGERELREEEEVGATAQQGEVICRGLHIIGLAEWRQPGPKAGGQRVVPRACRRMYSEPCMEQPGRVILESPRPLAASTRAWATAASRCPHYKTQMGLGRPSTPGAYVMPLCGAEDHILHTSTFHAGEGASHPSRAGVCSAP